MNCGLTVSGGRLNPRALADQEVDQRPAAGRCSGGEAGEAGQRVEMVNTDTGHVKDKLTNLQTQEGCHHSLILIICELESRAFNDADAIHEYCCFFYNIFKYVLLI